MDEQIVAGAVLFAGDALNAYARWEGPTVIVSDGPYGIEGYEGDASSPEMLPALYASHVDAWSAAATSRTTLWFWCDEAGWAFIHPAILARGWAFRGLNVWDKGPAYLDYRALREAAKGRPDRGSAGRFPKATEVCGHYVRDPEGAAWHPEPGLWNVWSEPLLHGPERLRGPEGVFAHPCQKPLSLMERIIRASSDPGDAVWEPFAGLASASAAALALGRRPFAAERDARYAAIAAARLGLAAT